VMATAVNHDALGAAVIASEAKLSRSRKRILDCFVVSLFAMTRVSILSYLL
jgi:hypothetical protein